MFFFPIFDQVLQNATSQSLSISGGQYAQYQIPPQQLQPTHVIQQHYSRHETVTPPGGEYGELIKVEPKPNSSNIAHSQIYTNYGSSSASTPKYQDPSSGKITTDLNNSGYAAAPPSNKTGYQEWPEVNRGQNYVPYSNGGNMPPPPPAHSNAAPAPPHPGHYPPYNSWEGSQTYMSQQYTGYPVQGII